MTSFIVAGEAVARITTSDAADHVVTATIDDASTPEFMKAAVPGSPAVVVTAWERIQVAIVNTDPQTRTATFTIGNPS